MKKRLPKAGKAARPSDAAVRMEARLDRRTERWCLLALLALIVLFRVLYRIELGSYVDKSGDAEFFLGLGRKVASGNVFLRGESLIFSPLYYYFLGAVFALFGENFSVVLLLQGMLGAAGAFLVYRLARDLFGPLSALVTLLLYAFYWIFLVYETQLIDTTFSVFLPAAILLLLHRAGRSRGFLLWALSGFFLGLFGLARPNALFFVPPAVGWAYYASRSMTTVRGGLLRSATLVGGIVLALLPLSIRNWSVSGVPTPVPAHGGINFYVGNNEHATGFFTPPPEMPPLPGAFNLEIPRQVAEFQTGRTGMTDSEVSSYWFHKGLSFVTEHPDRFLRFTLRKTRAFLNAYEVPSNIDPYFLRKISRVLRILFVGAGIVLPLGLLGMFLAGREWRRHLPSYLFFASYMLSVILFYVNDRYRIPVVPVLLVYAGFALRSLVANLSKPAALGGQAGAVLLLALFVNSDLNIRLNPAYVAHARGYVMESMHRPNDAISYYRQALRLNPNLGLTHRQMAGLLASRGDTAEARSHYEAALRLMPADTVLAREWRIFQERVGGVKSAAGN